jgi:hypothetical protein
MFIQIKFFLLTFFDGWIGWASVFIHLPFSQNLDTNGSPNKHVLKLFSQDYNVWELGI